MAVTMPTAPLALGGAGEHVHIAEGGGPGPHIAGLQRALDRRGIAGSNFFERLVHDGLYCCTYAPQVQPGPQRDRAGAATPLCRSGPMVVQPKK